jgi:hypothetical protein
LIRVERARPIQPLPIIAHPPTIKSQHHNFASAAAYNLQCLHSCFHQGGKGGGSGSAEQDAATALRLQEAGGVEAIVVALKAGTDKGSNAISLTLVQAGARCLSRCLELRPGPTAARIEAVGGIDTILAALKGMDADERPHESLQLLGLMAQADAAYAQALVRGKGMELLLQTLKAALAGDDQDTALHATLALGAVAAAGLAAATTADASPLACEEALPDAPKRTALGDLVLKAMTTAHLDRQTLNVTPRLLRTTTAKAVAASSGRTSPLFFATDGAAEGPGPGAGAGGDGDKTMSMAGSAGASSSGPVAVLRAHVMCLLWLCQALGNEGALCESMAQAGVPKLLTEAVGDLEEQLVAPDLLPAIGSLLHHIAGPALDQARARLSVDAVAQAIAAADPPSSPSASSPMAALESSLRLVGALAHAPAGRAAIMAAGEEGQEQGAGAADLVLAGLLHICQAEVAPYGLLKAALRTLDCLAMDARYGPLLLQRQALDTAMGLLRRDRDRESEGVDRLPLEIVAAAASLVARLTEVHINVGKEDVRLRPSLSPFY